MVRDELDLLHFSFDAINSIQLQAGLYKFLYWRIGSYHLLDLSSHQEQLHESRLPVFLRCKGHLMLLEGTQQNALTHFWPQ